MTVYFEGFKNDDDDDDDDVKEEDDEEDDRPDSDMAGTGTCTGTDLTMSSSNDSKHFVIHPTTPFIRILSWPFLGCSIENEGLLIEAIVLCYCYYFMERLIIHRGYYQQEYPR